MKSMKSNIGIIIEREYLERVKKKSFIITTILMPIFMLAMMAMPAIIMAVGGESEAKIAVVDESHIILPRLENSETVKFQPALNASIDSVLANEGVDAVLVIPPNVVDDKNLSLKYYTASPSSVTTEGDVSSQINSILEKKRLEHYNIDDLDKILADVKGKVTIDTIRVDKGSEESESTGFSFGVAMVMTFVLYMFLLLYGQMVMTSIIEEKNNRVLELVVSSVKPMELMMGKIIGIALVAVTQIVIWGVLLALMAAFLLPALIPADAMADIVAVQSGDISGVSSTESVEMLKAVGMMSNVGKIIGLVAWMSVFLILGFLIYSSIFAAIGSSVDNVQDASQLSTVAVVPIVFGLIFAMAAAADPMGQLAFWASIFPLTAPMVMVARIPFGIPQWEIWLALALLVLTFIGLVWMAGRIYRIGIFMHGKKPTVKDLVAWMKYK